MNIQLKQHEIEAALRHYVSKQGINLANKTMKVVFTAGRKEGGLTADLTIEDATIPGFQDVAEEVVHPAKATNDDPKPAVASSDVNTNVTGQVVTSDIKPADLVKADAAVAAIATTATEAAIAEPVAEAKVAEAAPVAAAVAETVTATAEAQPVAEAEAAPAKVTTSLFGG